MTDKHPLKVLNQLWDTQDTYKNPYDLPEMHFLKNLTQKCGSQDKVPILPSELLANSAPVVGAASLVWHQHNHQPIAQ